MAEPITSACECCGFVTELMPYTVKGEYEIRNNLPPSTRLYCRVCVSTSVSMMTRYPTQYPSGLAALGQLLAWMYNDFLHRSDASFRRDI